jgi:hypothetical protein
MFEMKRRVFWQEEKFLLFLINYGAGLLGASLFRMHASEYFSVYEKEEEEATSFYKII